MLADVLVASPQVGDVLTFDGNRWKNCKIGNNFLSYDTIDKLLRRIDSVSDETVQW